MKKDENGFILRYGNRKEVMPLDEQLAFYVNVGNVRLIIDGGEMIEFNHEGNPSDRERAIIEKYGDYGVKSVAVISTCTEIVIGKLTA